MRSWTLTVGEATKKKRSNKTKLNNPVTEVTAVPQPQLQALNAAAQTGLGTAFSKTYSAAKA